MDEATWLTCTNPYEMLDFIGDNESDRKLRLFAVACGRRVWYLLRDPRVWTALEACESFADERITQQQFRTAVEPLKAAEEAASRVIEMANCAVAGATVDSAAYAARNAAGWAADAAAEQVVEEAELEDGTTYQAADRAGGDEERGQCALLRCIFGNPYRPVRLKHSWMDWNDGIVPRLAQAAYDERILPAGTLDNARLAVLADALEEAGCSDEQILGHLRSGGEHYRGCFVVDALLGKS